MREFDEPAQSRRALLKTGGLIAGALVVPQGVAAAVGLPNPKPAPIPASAWAPPAKVAAAPLRSLGAVRPELFRRALAALDRHGDRVTLRDRIVIADFAQASAQPRFHLVDLANGTTKSLLVAHGSGSDPSHTGWLKRFSNDFGSNASSEGAFLAADYYVGKHGRSQRLIGLDPTNSNALGRALVVHAAWYANPDMLATHGMLGRSQGCFAVGDKDLEKVFDRLGPGRMIYAAKV